MRLTTFATGMALAALMVPTEALACSCVAGMAYSLPRWNSTDAPLNTTLQLGYVFDSAPGEFQLVDTFGNIVATDKATAVAGGTEEVTLSLAPGLQLSAHTAYQLLGDGQLQLEFSTGDQVDAQAPTFGGILSFEGGYDDGCTQDGDVVYCDSCGPSTELRVSYGESEDNLTLAAHLLYRVYVEVGGATPTTDSYSYVSPGWAVGQGACNSTYPGLEVGDAVTIRAQVLDAAGNASPLGAPVTTFVEDDPDNETGGCSGAPAGRAPVAGLTLLGLLGAGLIRRRRA